jgi:hypothetical protein
MIAAAGLTLPDARDWLAGHVAQDDDAADAA